MAEADLRCKPSRNKPDESVRCLAIGHLVHSECDPPACREHMPDPIPWFGARQSVMVNILDLRSRFIDQRAIEAGFL